MSPDTGRFVIWTDLPDLFHQVSLFFGFISSSEFCSARGSLQKVNLRSSLKTKVRPWGTATLGSARPGMFVLAGGVDGGGIGVGVSSQHGVVLGAEHVEQSTVSTQRT